MQSLLRAPEIVTIIFQQCDCFRDIVALASTCKTLDAIWRNSSRHIIWPSVESLKVPAFEQALVAASSALRPKHPKRDLC